MIYQILKNNNKLLKIATFLTIFLLMAAFSITGCGCSSQESNSEIKSIQENDKQDKQSKNEKANNEQKEKSSQSIAEEKKDIQKENVNPETEEKEDTEEIEEDEIKQEHNLVTLQTSYIGENFGSLILKVNLENGNVNGYLIMRITDTLLIGTTTKICYYLVKGKINGSINLETRDINGTFSGKVISEDAECQSGDISYTMTGKLTKDHKHVIGNLTSNTGKTYKFVLR